MGSPETQRVGRTERSLLLQPWPPQKKMTSSLLASSLEFSGVAGSGEGDGGTGGKDVPPALREMTSGVMSTRVGLRAGKQGSGKERGPGA
jgi:hypothetical protein